MINNKNILKSIKSALQVILLTLVSFNWGFSQTLDEEIGFIYVKAEYLYETGRYDEAITEYTIVIDKNPKYKEALAHRGLAKFAFGYTQDAQKDALTSIELNGIQAESAALLGRTFASLNEYVAAISSMTAAISLDDKNGDYFEWRAAYYEEIGKLTQACQDYTQAYAYGNQNVGSKVKSLCGNKTGNTTKPDIVDNTPKRNQEPNINPNEVGKDEVLSDGHRENSDEYNTGHTEDTEHQVQEEVVPKEDDTVNNFVIDDDLSIEISGQELGHRKINEIPSILILADENGKVTVNICVNKMGEVTKAEFNPSLSTVAKKSLVSLALRKAKEFEFAPGKYDFQCGIMVFKIKGL